MSQVSKKSNVSPSYSASRSKENVPSTGLLSFVVEPALLVHMMTIIMVFVVLQDFLVEKACLVNLGYSEKVCTALKLREGIDNYQNEEKEVQKLTGTVMMIRQMLENVCPIFLVLLIGAWSDKYGRKYPMLFVTLGFIVQDIALILCVYLTSATGAWTVALVSSLIPGLVGNQACFGMAVFSYVSDTTSVEKRTVRNGIAHIFFFAGLVLGMAFGGIMSKSSLSYTQIFGIGLVLETLVFIWILVAVKHIRDEDAVKGKSMGDMIQDLFNFQHIKDAVSSVTKTRSGNDRKMLLWLLAAHALLMTPMMGEMGVMYLFTRIKFNWDSGELSAFMTYKMIIGFIGNFVSMGVLSQALKLSDPAVGIAAATSALVSFALSATANTNFMMYLCPVIAILGGANMIIPRSIISKIIPTNEIGKVNSFLASLDSIVPMFSGLIYTVLYQRTFEVFPGAFFLLSAVLTVPPILIYWWVLSVSPKEETRKEK